MKYDAHTAEGPDRTLDTDQSKWQPRPAHPGRVTDYPEKFIAALNPSAKPELAGLLLHDL